MMSDDNGEMDVEDCHIQPLIEMSQDCIVEWNESQDVSIPESSTTTPMADRAGRGTTTSSSSGSSKSGGGRRQRRSIGLEEVRRKLEEQQGTNHPHHRDQQKNWSSSRSKGSGEEEIDAIFHLLKQEDEGLVGISPTNAATQQTGNQQRIEAKDSYRSRPTVSSLASRRRRRQREGGPAVISNKRKQTAGRPGEGEEASLLPNAPQCNTPPPISVSTEGAFDSLLKQLTTRPSSERKIPIPRPTSDKENPSILLPVVPGGTNTKSPLKAVTAATAATIHQRKELASSNSRPPRPLGRSSSASLTPSSKPASSGNEERHLPRHNPQKPPSDRTNHCSKPPPPQKVEPAADAARAPQKQQDDDEDEFGDFDFDDVDMACLDSLLSAKSSQQAVVVHSNPSTSHQSILPPKQNPIQQDTKHMGPVTTQTQQLRAPASSSNATTSTVPVKHDPTAPTILPQKPRAAPTVATVKREETPPSAPVLSQQAIVEDEFGEFPDFDFDMIDEAIATRQEHSTSQSNPADPLTEEIVKNQRSYSNDPSGLSFIKFARYKILKIEQDTINFRKTLLVASWTDGMLQDEQEETKIHRDCQIEIVPGDSKGTAHLPRNTNYPEAGYVQLRGQWYYTMLEVGDAINVCSLTGRFRTDPSALPIVLHTHPPGNSEPDDLVLIHHPDLLMTPTAVSETVDCPRRAVLRSRNGSTGLTAKSALIGTLRHDLFGWCIKEQNFEKAFVVRKAKQIVRENAEGLLGCSVATEEAEKQLVDTLPIILEFVREHTTFLSPNKASSLPTAYVQGHMGGSKGVRFAAHSTFSIEEPVISPELALKGYVDAVLETTTAAAGSENDNSQHAITGLKHSIMALELKTGHHQASRNTHMGQLSLYTLMLQGRYGAKIDSSTQILSQRAPGRTGKPDPEGAAPGGMLLYLNHESSKATHVAPEFEEFKSLIGQRNIIAADLVKASKPRGISLQYENEKSMDDQKGQRVTLFEAAPAVELPEVQPSDHSCKRCFENRTCMLYANSETEKSDLTGVRKSHGELMTKFTGQLLPGDLDYFRKWDRLIDMEAHASVGNIATAWLVDSQSREKATGESISSLVYDGASPSQEGSGVLLRFRRATDFCSQVKLSSLSIGKGSHVVISTDGNAFDDSQSDPKLEYMNTQRERKKFRHHMNVIRGYLQEARSDEVVISAKREDLDRVRHMCSRYKKFSNDDGQSALMFRVDKDNSAVGIGTLRQNLINLFTADHARSSKEELSKLDVARQRRLPRLRDSIVRLEVPSFGSTDDSLLFRAAGPRIPGCDLQDLSKEFQTLNQDQQSAVRKVLAAHDYTLIQGLPGTGKTSTLVFITRLLVARGKRVLVTSYTNAAVDNVVIKLLESGVGTSDSNTVFSSVVRVGPRHSCHEIARSVHVNDIAVNVENMTENTDQELLLSQSVPNRTSPPRAESLGRVMSEARIVCSTVLTVPRSPLLVNELFDVVIVDEAGQTSQPAILGALMAADSFVLVGDHKQLPPLVSSEIAQAGGYGESMLMRLAEMHPSTVAALTYQYRMNEEICKLSSYLIYGGRLKCGNEEVRHRKLDLPGFPNALPVTVSQTKGLWPWLKMTVSPENPVIFVDTDNMRKIPPNGTSNKENVTMEALEEKRGGRAGGKVTNPIEAILARYIIKGLISSGANPKEIGVISPFRAQVQIFQDDPAMADWKKSGLEFSTIDRYQGRDKPVIILSLVRSNPDGNVGRLLQDKRRLNVALTRSKAKLIIVGSYSTLHKGSTALRPMLGRINSQGRRQLLPENALDCYQIP